MPVATPFRFFGVRPAQNFEDAGYAEMNQQDIGEASPSNTVQLATFAEAVTQYFNQDEVLIDCNVDVTENGNNLVFDLDNSFKPAGTREPVDRITYFFVAGNGDKNVYLPGGARAEMDVRLNALNFRQDTTDTDLYWLQWIIGLTVWNAAGSGRWSWVPSELGPIREAQGWGKIGDSSLSLMGTSYPRWVMEYPAGTAPALTINSYHMTITNTFWTYPAP